jgi:hypothetical protein
MGLPPFRLAIGVAHREPLDWIMKLSCAEEVAVRRAIVAYRAMQEKSRKGAFLGVTADQILEELRPTPARWVALASLVVALAQDEFVL